MEDEKDGRLNADEIAEEVRKHYKGDLKYCAGTFWAWDEKRKVWVPIEDGVIKQMIDEIDRPHSTNPRINSALGVLKARVRIDKMNLRPDLLNLKNGSFLDVSSMFILPPSKDHLHTIQLSVNHNPEAKCSRFQQFLDEIFEGDADKEEKKLLL